jgi:hypothetical protein
MMDFRVLDDRGIGIFSGFALQRGEHFEMLSVVAYGEVQRRTPLGCVVVDHHDTTIPESDRIDARIRIEHIKTMRLRPCKPVVKRVCGDHASYPRGRPGVVTKVLSA